MVVIVCHKCSHSWDYTGDSDRATCPECNVKVPVDRTTLTDLRERVTDLEEQVEQREEAIEWLVDRVQENGKLAARLEDALTRRNYLKPEDLGYNRGREDND